MKQDIPSAGSEVRFDSSVNPHLFPFLEGVRSAIIGTGLIALPFACAGYAVAGRAIAYLQRATGVTLAAFSLPEAFLSHLALGLSLGLIVSLPYLQFKILSVLPRMYSVTRREATLFWLGSVFLFFTGALFSLLVPLPYGVQFLSGFETETIRAVISVRKFVSFCLMFIFGFGLIFELPVVMILLGWIGLIDARRLGRYRRYAVLGIFILSAVLTPTPDLFNMMMMAAPLYLLFEIGLLCMRFVGKKR